MQRLMRTQKEIDEQVTWLKTNKNKIGQFNVFDEDNHAEIDAEIEVLEEHLDEDDCQEKVDNGDWTEGQMEAARDALNWRDEGDDDAKPSESWGHLAK
jgi:hypothetical protein